MNGDLHAAKTMEFVRLLTNCQGVLQAFIASVMPGHPDTADVLQETNLTLWEKMDQFEPGTNFQAWAFSIARFKALAHLKKCRNSKLAVFDDEVLERLARVAAERDPALYDAKVRALQGCLADLRPADRELLEVRYGVRETLEDYARKIGRPANSLYNTLVRLRAGLRTCIQARLRHEGGAA
jgi:RNA polymerase sigma-70 factor (ECF subfamily)